MAIEIAMWGPERHAEFTAPLRTAFGLQFDAERAARVQRLPEMFHRVAALDGSAIVGSAGTYRFDMTTPGGSVPTAGLTMVGVVPTHRRRGVLTRMMRRHIDEARATGLVVSALWASEGSIYGRFGYGIASFCGSVNIERDRAAFNRPVPREGSFRLVDEATAVRTFAGVWDEVRPKVPGMLSRSPFWWEHRRIGDYDKTAAPLQRLLLEMDGKPAGYALYRVGKIRMEGALDGELSVVEALAATPEANATLWRYLCDVDLMRHIQAHCLPLTHPLVHLLREPRRLHMTMGEALWVRLIDVEAALAARRWSSSGSCTFQLADEQCPWNSGSFHVDGARGLVTRSEAPAEVRLDAAALGSLYLGGVTLRELADAGAVPSCSDASIDAVDALFRSPRTPWCPEIF